MISDRDDSDAQPGTLTPRRAQALADRMVPLLPDGPEDAFIDAAREYLETHHPELTEYDASAVIFRALRGPRRRRTGGRRALGRPADAGGEAQPSPDAEAEMLKLFRGLTEDGRAAIITILRLAAGDRW